MGVIFDDQQHGVTRGHVVPVIGNMLFSGQWQRDYRMDGVHRLQLGAAGARSALRARVVQGQIQGKHTAFAVHAGQPDLTAQQGSQLTADGKPQTGPPVFARGAGIRLLESFKDQTLLVWRDANAGVFHRERNHLLGGAQHWVVCGPPPCGKAYPHFHLTLGRELHRIGQQVLQNLLQTLGVTVHGARQVVREVDVEGQVFGFCDMAEVAINVVAQAGEGNLFHLHRDRAGFDLRQIQNVVNEVQQVGARRIDVA